MKNLLIIFTLIVSSLYSINSFATSCGATFESQMITNSFCQNAFSNLFNGSNGNNNINVICIISDPTTVRIFGSYYNFYASIRTIDTYYSYCANTNSDGSSDFPVGQDVTSPPPPNQICWDGSSIPPTDSCPPLPTCGIGTAPDGLGGCVDITNPTPDHPSICNAEGWSCTLIEGEFEIYPDCSQIVGGLCINEQNILENKSLPTYCTPNTPCTSWEPSGTPPQSCTDSGDAGQCSLNTTCSGSGTNESCQSSWNPSPTSSPSSSGFGGSGGGGDTSTSGGGRSGSGSGTSIETGDGGTDFNNPNLLDINPDDFSSDDETIDEPTIANDTSNLESIVKNTGISAENNQSMFNYMMAETDLKIDFYKNTYENAKKNFQIQQDTNYLARAADDRDNLLTDIRDSLDKQSNDDDNEVQEAIDILGIYQGEVDDTTINNDINNFITGLDNTETTLFMDQTSLENYLTGTTDVHDSFIDSLLPDQLFPSLPSGECVQGDGIHTSYHSSILNKTFSIDIEPCQKLQPLRDALAWIFAVLVTYQCFSILFRSS